MLKIIAFVLAAFMAVPIPLWLAAGALAFSVETAFASDDDDDDDSDDDDDDDDDHGGGSSSSNSGNDSDERWKRSGGRASVGNIHLRYPNGWDEQIRNGRYRLTDPQGRTVSSRRATQGDMIRMRAIASQ